MVGFIHHPWPAKQLLITVGQLGRLTHYAFDAVLSMFYYGSKLIPHARSLFTVSTILAGMKRSTGLT